MIAIMQQYRCEPADCAQIVIREHLGHLGGCSRQKALRSDFGCREADFAHFAENLRGVELIAPVRDFAHAPGRSVAPAMRGVLMCVPHSCREGTDL